MGVKNFPFVLFVIFLLVFFACESKNDDDDGDDGIYPRYLDLSELVGMENVTKCDDISSPVSLTKNEISELLQDLTEEYQALLEEFPELLEDYQELPEACEYYHMPLCNYIVEIKGKKWTICTPGRSMSYLCGYVYVSWLNKNKYCGYDDWDIPSASDLEEIYDIGTTRVDGEGLPVHIAKPFHIDASIIQIDSLIQRDYGDIDNKNLSFYDGDIRQTAIDHGDPEELDRGGYQNLWFRILAVKQAESDQ